MFYGELFSFENYPHFCLLSDILSWSFNFDWIFNLSRLYGQIFLIHMTKFFVKFDIPTFILPFMIYKDDLFEELMIKQLFN